MRNVLVTGGAGFIGSHYLRLLLSTDEEVQVVNADALTYSANIANNEGVKEDPRYRFAHVDITDRDQLEGLFAQYHFDEVIHFAAESHVDRSIDSAEPFIRTNIEGTYQLIHNSIKYGVKKFVHISTDEVYGSFPVGRANESTPLHPGNPYSASKASSDLLCLAYYQTVGFPVVITRCTNNYGPHQHPEKLIPRIISCLVEGKQIPLYGNGLQQRDWLHVEDHCRAIELVRANGRLGEVYHIGAEHTVTNLRVAREILDYFSLPTTKIDLVPDRPGHDLRYSLDTKKIKQELGWKPSISFTEGIKQTIEWYVTHPTWWDHVQGMEESG